VLICSLPSNCKEQAGKSQGFHNHLRDPTATFHGLQLLVCISMNIKHGLHVVKLPLPRFQGVLKTGQKERWGFNLVGIAAVKSCNDQEA
jgi:hypothetical protein